MPSHYTIHQLPHTLKASTTTTLRREHAWTRGPAHASTHRLRTSRLRHRSSTQQQHIIPCSILIVCLYSPPFIIITDRKYGVTIYLLHSLPRTTYFHHPIYSLHLESSYYLLIRHSGANKITRRQSHIDPREVLHNTYPWPYSCSHSILCSVHLFLLV